MSSTPAPLVARQHNEIAHLIETLRRTEQRLEELTGGEVDAVADRDGRTYVLRRAQENLRKSETARQTAILNALPARIALLDLQGSIVSVNEGWKRFCQANEPTCPGHGVGVNYLEVCDNSSGPDAGEAPEVARGIRGVLDGVLKQFSAEYACHSPSEQRWFRITVTPLRNGTPGGAVVMHVDITDRKRAELERDRERQVLRTLLDALSDAVYTTDTEGRFVVRNRATLALFGFAHESQMVGKTVFDVVLAAHAEQVHRDDLLVRGGLAMLRREEQGDALEETLVSSMAAGGAAFVVMPFSLDSLTEKLNQVLHRPGPAP